MEWDDTDNANPLRMRSEASSPPEGLTANQKAGCASFALLILLVLVFQTIFDGDASDEKSRAGSRNNSVPAKSPEYRSQTSQPHPGSPLAARKDAQGTTREPAKHASTTLTKKLAEDAKYKQLGDRQYEGLRELGPNPNTGLYEFWVEASGKAPIRRKDGHFVVDGSTAIVLVLIPGGTFRMGAQAESDQEPNFDPLSKYEYSEAPVHSVELGPFFLSKYELSQGQWVRLYGSNLSESQAHSMDVRSLLTLPAENVSWFQCLEYLEKVGLTLPTEAQWEYACRGGTSSPWWCDSQSLDAACAIGGSQTPDKTVVVDSLAANPFGLFNIHGNVWEWCFDWYLDYSKYTVRKGDGLRQGTGSERVNRGGSAFDSPAYARSANRFPDDPSLRNGSLGCRPARDLD